MAAPQPEPSRRVRAAVPLLALAGLAHIAFGIAALTGLEGLEGNVAEIEREVSGGLYASLAAWGVLLILAGGGELGAARSLRRNPATGVLWGLAAAFAGLAASFFTLPLLRVPGALALLLTLAVLYLLSYKPDGPSA